MSGDTVKCPNCGKKVPWSEGQVYKPFCCERCKLIDLGEWASEKKIIPGEPAMPDDRTDDDYFQ